MWSLFLLMLPLSALACPIQVFHDQIEARLEEAQQADPADGPVLERLKQLTFNYWDPRIPGKGDPTEAADPTRPLLTLDGRWRVDASGIDGFYFPSLEEFMRGGNHNSKRFPILRRWADGTPTSGPYHTGNHGWDGLIANWPIEDTQGRIIGYQAVGYLGMMEQPYKLIGAAEQGMTGREPQMPFHNYTRSRWAFEMSWIDGREVWTAVGPVFGNRPTLDGRWVSEHHHHGYGGRPLMDNEGKVFKWDGTYWMIFEQVTEQKTVQHDDGTISYLPWVTEVVAQRMKNPYQGYQKGDVLPDGRVVEDPVLLCGVRNADGSFNAASDRHGIGYLIEGFNLMGEPVPIGGKRYWIGFASPNNYTEKYGVTLWFREESLGPIGAYEPLTDSSGVWKDITEELRAQYGLEGWFGRGDGFFTPEDKAWIQKTGGKGEVPFKMIAHGVNPKSLPAGFPKIGWPKAEEYNFYIRAQWLLFGRFFASPDGKPAVRWMLPETKK